MMPSSTRENIFKTRMLEGETQFGLFCLSSAAQTADALSDSGFDFLLFDTEHSATSLPQLYSQILSVSPSSTQALVRMLMNEPELFKPVLDMGFDTIMVPNIKNAEQARAAVAAVRYPPLGTRGVGGTVRATRYGRDASYYERANSRICLVLQIESTEGLANLKEICALDGVDCLFFGPSDLSMDMNKNVQPGHPDVVQAIVAGISTVRACGKFAGVLSALDMARPYMDAGATVIGLGSDLGLLVKAADALVRTANSM